MVVAAVAAADGPAIVLVVVGQELLWSMRVTHWHNAQCELAGLRRPLDQHCGSLSQALMGLGLGLQSASRAFTRAGRHGRPRLVGCAIACWAAAVAADLACRVYEQLLRTVRGVPPVCLSAAATVLTPSSRACDTVLPCPARRRPPGVTLARLMAHRDPPR